MRSLLSALFVAALVAAAVDAAAQTAAPSFEVASIKVNSNPQSPRFFQAKNDRVSIGNVPLRMLLPLAYDVDPDQVRGGPAWVDTDRYDIVAKAAAPFAPETQWRAMLRTLLTDRFRLVVRRDAQPAQVFALVRARQDGSLGTELRRAATTCEELTKASPPPADACGLVAANQAGDTGRMSVRGQSMEMLARLLRGEAGQPIHDETGLTGAFDWDLVFAPRRSRESEVSAPSLFTALQEQLGLKLEPRRGTRDVLVIERIERPVVD
jgi:uncharacterized protein (TIGR03435 family)